MGDAGFCAERGEKLIVGGYCVVFLERGNLSGGDTLMCAEWGRI